MIKVMKNILYFNLNFITDINPKENEQKIIQQIFDLLKTQENEIKIEHIFIFSLSILNLFEYCEGNNINIWKFVPITIFINPSNENEKKTKKEK